MKTLLLPTLFLTGAAVAMAQFPGLTLPPSGNNQKASVTQFIGPVSVTIEYSSPAVHGPDGKDRRGQIWGKLVPYGMTDLGFGNGKPGPWRAGANENTVFAVSHDVLVQGKRLPAGRYGLHMMAGADEWTLIFSKNSTSWGSFFYEESEDVLRVAAKPKKHEYQEWLTYEFTERKPEETTVEMQWEDLALPWKVQVEKINEVYFTKISEELRTVPGFGYQGYVQGINFLVQNDLHLDQALKWADAAIAMPFVGQKTFTTLSAKAQVLTKMGKPGEAKTIMAEAIRMPGASPALIHQYGRSLITAKHPAEALEVFKLNFEKNGDAWPVHVGLARGYAATGDVRKALEHAQKALPQAPDDLNRNGLKSMIETFSKGENITQ